MNKKKIFAALTALVILCFALSGCVSQKDPVVYELYYTKDDDYLIGVAATAIESTVEIETTISNKAYAGSGVVIAAASGKTFIITNNHVIAGTSGTGSGTVYVYAAGSSHSFLKRQEATVLAQSSQNDKSDLALISISSTSYTPAKYSLEDLSFGQHILAVGNALDLGTSVCDGIVSNPSYALKETKYNFEGSVIQVTAPINSGNSGGGLFDMKARLIGINTFKATCAGPDESQTVFADSISFSIKMSDVKAFVEKYNKSISGTNKTSVEMTAG